MDSTTVEFWSAGISSDTDTSKRDKRLLANAAAVSAANFRKWTVPALQTLASERGLAFDTIGYDSPSLVAAIEAHTASVRASRAAKEQLGGWLGGHVSFREYGASLEEDAYVLLRAFNGSKRSGAENADPALSLQAAGLRVRRLGAGVRKLASAVHAHGSWEERVIFDFLRKELRSFEPFHVALTGEHHGTAEDAAEVSYPVICSRSNNDSRCGGQKRQH